MNATSAAPQPVKAPVAFSIKHLFCICEMDLPNKTAFCGVTLGPKRLDRTKLTPIELCVLCADIAESGAQICPKCGKASK